MVSLSSPVSSSSSLSRPSSYIYGFVLFLISLLTAQNFFNYHAPGAIAEQFESSYQLSTAQFGSLYTVYSAPNCILAFFSGVFIDRYGLRISSLCFNVFMLFGMLICAVTPYPSSHGWSPVRSYLSLLFGRLLLGFGESLCTAGNAMLTRWFAPINRINFAMSVNQAAVQLLGSSAAFFILPRVHSLYVSQWICAGVAALSVLANLVYNAIELHYETYLDIKRKEMDRAIEADNEGEREKLLSDGVTDGAGPTYASPLDRAETGGQSAPTQPHSELSVTHQSISEILSSFSPLFWLLLFHVALMSPILYTLTAFGPSMLEENFAATRNPEAAGDATALLYVSIVAAPVVGALIDRVGFRIQFQICASFFLPFLIFALIHEAFSPATTMFLIGLVFSITESNSLAMIACIVPSETQGSAYGLLSCAISIALLIEPAAIGYIREVTGSFILSLYIFIGLGVFGCVTAFLLWQMDRASGKHISCPAKQTEQPEPNQ